MPTVDVELVFRDGSTPVTKEPTAQVIRVNRGEDTTVRFTCYNSDGSARDLADHTFVLSITGDEAGDFELINRAGEVTDEPSGIAEAVLVPADTEGLTARTYYASVAVVDGGITWYPLPRSPMPIAPTAPRVPAEFTTATGDQILIALPAGGSVGQVPALTSTSPRALGWTDPAEAGDTLPDQTGNSGRVLGTNGTVASWVEPSGGVVGDVLAYSTIAQLRAAAAPESYARAIVDGYHEAGDGADDVLFWVSDSSLDDDGFLTFKPNSLADEDPGRWWRSRFRGSRYSVRLAGAYGDLTHDDTAAVQAVIDYLAGLPSPGGQVYFPGGEGGQYRIDGQLSMPETYGIQLIGDGSMNSPTIQAASWPSSSLHFYGDGAGWPTNLYGYPAFIDARSTGGFEMHGLGVLQAGSDDFEGLFLDLSHSDEGGDSALFDVSGNSFASIYYNGTNYTISAKAHISLAGCISGSITKNFFARAENAIRGVEEIGDSSIYSNIIGVHENHFIQLNGEGGAVCNPGQLWTITENTVEGLQQTAVDYLHTFVGYDLVSDDFANDLLTIKNNYCGDAFGDQQWIRLLPQSNCVIESNLLAGGDHGIVFYSNGGSPRCGGVSLKANEITTVEAGIDCGAGIEWNGLLIECNDVEDIDNLPEEYSVLVQSNKVLRTEGGVPDPTALGTRYIAAMTPTELAGAPGSPLQAWWKADAIVGLSDGDPVATWEDSSANNNDLAQASAPARPTYQTNVHFGLPAVRFDGTQYLAKTFANGNGYAVFMVCATDGGSYDAAHDCFFDGSTNNTMRLKRASTSSMDAGGVPLGANPTDWTVYCLEQNGEGDASSVMRAGDVAVQGEPTWVSPGAGITIGARGDGTNGAAIDVGEVVVANRPLRPSERLGIVNYLRAKWNAL